MFEIMKRIRKSSIIFISIELLSVIILYLLTTIESIKLTNILVPEGDLIYIFMIITALIIIQMFYLFNLYHKIDKKILVNYINIASTLGADIKESYHFAELAMMAYDEDQEIIWTSELLEERGIDIIGSRFNDLYPELSKLLLDDSKTVNIEINSRIYEVKVLLELKLFILKDTTDYNKIESAMRSQSPVVMQIIIDNYQDISNISDESTLNERILRTRELINAYSEKYSILLKKHRSDGFLGILTERSYQKILSDNFSILDSVRNVGVRDQYLTLSIAIGRGSDDVVKLGELSNNAIDVAFSRGGDQVVVNTFGQNLEFFGGKSESKTSQNKVRIRVLAQSLAVHIENARNILIMGHINADLDALGASLGIHTICQHFKVPTKIVYEDKLYEQSTRKAFKSSFTKELIASMTVTVSQALNLINPDTLLIVVDVHRPDLTLAPKLVETCDKVAIIDHHRRGEEFIESPIFSVIEPSSSSTSEMVAEYIKYSPETIDVSPEVATMMLAGILLDTNNYRRQTGARTFDASMILKEFGADSEKSNDFLKDDYEEYLLINKIKANTFTPFWGILISIAAPEDIVDRTTLAKIATDGMDVKDINAIFVIGRTSQDDVSISARSNSNINVQLILETLGGGGHFTAAAAKFSNKSIEYVKEELLKSIESYLDKNKTK